MSMKASSNGDVVLIIDDGFFRSHVVGKYYPETNTLEMVNGYAPYLPRALDAVREHKREQKRPAAPVKVEYW